MDVLTANVQDLLDEICPDPKVHYLCHIVRDVIRFGPVLHQATERHEKFNIVAAPSAGMDKLIVVMWRLGLLMLEHVPIW